MSILTERAWSVEDLLYGFRGNVSCGRQWILPNGQDSAILPAHEAKCVIMIEHIARLTVPIRRFDIHI